MATEDVTPEPPEDFESLTSEEEEQIKESFDSLKKRLDRLEHENAEGFYALKNQKRLLYYLEELSRVLEESLDVSLPDPPTLETPDQE